MTKLQHFLEANVGLFAALGLAWFTLMVGLSIVRRRRKGKPLYPKKPANAVFFESGAAGHSQKDFKSRLGGASRCLMVAVTPEELQVVPNFPFNLMFLPEIYDLEHKIRREDVISVTEEKSALLGDKATVVFRVPTGEQRTIVLRLKHTADFLQALTP